MSTLSNEAIEELLLHHSGAIDRIIYDFGYESPQNGRERREALLQLIELEGPKANALLQELISQKPDPSHDCFCGCGGLNYSGAMEGSPVELPPIEPPVELSRMNPWEVHSRMLRWQLLTYGLGTALLILLAIKLSPARHG